MPATPLVTVCVPAYRAAGFLPQTLASVRDQVFQDFRVNVGIEPDGADETLQACAEFALDDRFEFVVNQTTLGWPGNVRRALGNVRTPLFAILPHDDLWHPQYLSRLVGTLASRPDAVAAFPDTYMFRPPAGIRTTDLPDAPLAQQLLMFFVTGAHGFPWRGLARSQVLSEQFPSNEFRGFAVECEWAAHLILSGRVLRQPEPLYLKRQWPDDAQDSVSIGWRFRMDPVTLQSALTHHRRQMLSVVERANLPTAEAELITLAVDTAMLTRWMNFSGQRFDLPADIDADVYRLTAELEHAGPVGRGLLSQLLAARSRHLTERGQDDRAWGCARRALDVGPDNPAALVQFARLLLRQRRPADALRLISRASSITPMAVGLAEMQAACSLQLAQAHPFPAELG